MKPSIKEVLPLARAYCSKPGNAEGGNLHIVLGDGNIKDSNIEFCADQCSMNGDKEGLSLCRLLLGMSKTQRNKIYKIL